ncbi:hypothetical protein BDD12DRAFT_870858 [Trichophaea hybrida]|nr:hypothetical protein BDD12DRAFT_870858 [Trichophaea hybrida]
MQGSVDDRFFPVDLNPPLPPRLHLSLCLNPTIQWNTSTRVFPSHNDGGRRYGSGFLKRCLVAMNNDAEAVVEALKTGALPEYVRDKDWFEELDEGGNFKVAEGQ